MTAPNAELAYKVLDLTKAYPSNFDMDQWADGQLDLVGLDELTKPGCGTTACFAGWTAAQAGYQVSNDGGVYSGKEFVTKDIELFAGNLLGLTAEQANVLFYVSDDEIEDAVAEFFGPRPAVTA